ncbi:MAG: universal stress protein [Fuerstiella sp.]
MMQVKNILVPTDFSDNAKAAVDYGCHMARQFKADLHLVSVVENLANYAIEMEMVGTSAFAFDLVEAEKQAMQRLEKLPKSAVDGFKVIRQTVVSSPCQGITRYAKENEIDLIVISTHGRTGLTHFLMGSVAENVVRTAPCPVLTVRPEGHQFIDQASADKMTNV